MRRYQVLRTALNVYRLLDSRTGATYEGLDELAAEAMAESLNRAFGGGR